MVGRNVSNTIGAIVHIKRETTVDRLDELVAEVRKIAAERPDTRYEHKGCFYDQNECSDGSVGCVFGQAFRAIDWVPYKSGEKFYIAGVLLREGYASSDLRLKWCGVFQCQQDRGFTWEEGIVVADEEIHLT